MKILILETTNFALSITQQKLFLKGQEYDVQDKVGRRLIEISVAKSVVEKQDDPVVEKQDDPVVEKQDDPVVEKQDDPVVENKVIDPVVENRSITETKKRGRPPKAKK